MLTHVVSGEVVSLSLMRQNSCRPVSGEAGFISDQTKVSMPYTLRVASRTVTILFLFQSLDFGFRNTLDHFTTGQTRNVIVQMHYISRTLTSQRGCRFLGRMSNPEEMQAKRRKLQSGCFPAEPTREHVTTIHLATYVCSANTTFFFSGFGFESPALVCFLLLSSLTLRASNIVCLRLSVDRTVFGRWRDL